jgi:coproporphyrinogen III oxidase-like Fe-S oxidoreductase
VDAYLAAADPIASTERPAPRALATELLWSTLRHVDGVDRAELRARTGLDVRVPDDLVRAGLLAAEGDAVTLRSPGFPLADGLARRLADTLADGGASGASSRSGRFVESSSTT